MDFQKELSPDKSMMFDYTPAFGLPASVRVDVYRHGNDRHIIIATEIDDNPGPSITNSVEDFVKSFLSETGLSYDKCVFIESYRWAFEGERPPTYDMITFHDDKNFTGPQWKRLRDIDLTIFIAAIRHYRTASGIIKGEVR